MLLSTWKRFLSPEFFWRRHEPLLPVGTPKVWCWDVMQKLRNKEIELYGACEEVGFQVSKKEFCETLADALETQSLSVRKT